LSALADDGYGNLIPTTPKPEGQTHVYARINGRLARWLVDTPDHHLAINALRSELHERIKPVLAVIVGGPHKEMSE
jgi:hypothetical protein